MKVPVGPLKARSEIFVPLAKSGSTSVACSENMTPLPSVASLKSVSVRLAAELTMADEFLSSVNWKPTPWVTLLGAEASRPAAASAIRPAICAAR